MDGEGEPWGNPFRTVKLWDNLVCIRLCAGFFHLSLQIYCLPFSTPVKGGSERSTSADSLPQLP